MDVTELEGLAARILDEWGKGPPVDLFELARDCGFVVRFGSAASLVGNIITVDDSLRPEKQRWDAGHELAHALLEQARLPEAEPTVQYLTSCLLLPRLDFLRDVRRLGRDPWRLKERHPWASHEAIARRLVSQEPSVLWIWDRGPGGEESLYKVVTPGWRWPLRQPTALEQQALDEAAEAGGEPVRPLGGVVAWEVAEPGWRRVLCLSDAEVLLDAFCLD